MKRAWQPCLQTEEGDLTEAGLKPAHLGALPLPPVKNRGFWEGRDAEGGAQTPVRGTHWCIPRVGGVRRSDKEVLYLSAPSRGFAIL